MHSLISAPSPRRPLTSLLLALLALAGLGTLPATAQQLPNFEEWEDCVPWTSTGNLDVKGDQPKGWTISHVIGVNGAGATVVGEKIDDKDFGSAVMVKNSPNPLMSSQIVPGYFTLGTTWSTSTGALTITNKDGGTFGGIKINSRPDGIHFYYKRKGTETPATVVAYAWKGTFTQKGVPGNIVLGGSPTTVDMVNRDRIILGIKTDTGGDMEKSEGAALIASITEQISTVTDEWTPITVRMKYVSKENPEMFNVIFAANDYFSSSNIDKDNSLSVTEPKFVYLSKLSSISIDGKKIKEFDESKYDYEVSTLPAKVEVEVLGAAATAEITEEEGKIVITVTNHDGEDEDGERTHVYTITVGENGSDEPDEPAIERPKPELTQLPNPGFAEWKDCVPWTSAGNTKTQGTQPEYWHISNIVGVEGALFVNGSGATTVGSRVEGPDGNYAVEVSNKNIKYAGFSHVVPGYVTLGTPWSTSKSGANNDGGTWGGRKFGYHPDGLNFSYKRSGNTTPATVVAYTWKGIYTQAKVPGHISTVSVKEVDMDDRERNILGMTTTKGGAVTHTDDAALVAKAIHSLSDTPSDWTKITVPFEYENPDATPEKINVIFAASDYFNSDNTVAGNSLTVAEPKLVYWSKLSSIEIKGQPAIEIKDGKYEYSVSSLPATDDVNPIVLGAAATVAYKKEVDGRIAIKVINTEGADEEGLYEHTYYLTPDEVCSVEGYLSITDSDGDVTVIPTTVDFRKNADGRMNLSIDGLVIKPLHFDEVNFYDASYSASADSEGRHDFNDCSRTVTVMDGSIEAEVSIEAGSWVDFSQGEASLRLGIEVPAWGAHGNASATFTMDAPTVPEEPTEPDQPEVPEQPAKPVTVTKYPGTITFTVKPDYDSEETSGHNLQVMVTVTDKGETDAQGNSIVSIDFPAMKFHKEYWLGGSEDDFYYLYDFAPFTLGDVTAAYNENSGTTLYYRSRGPVPFGSEDDDSSETHDVELSGSATDDGILRLALYIGGEGYGYYQDVKGSFTNSPKPAGDVYAGTLTIEMGGQDITGGGQDATVSIIPDETGSNATFILPDFTLASLGMNLGDIRVDNVEVTTDGSGYRYYNGYVNGLTLAGGITANVDLYGSVSDSGEADMTILVNWEGIIIRVRFNGTLSESTTGIETPKAPGAGADNAEAEWFTLSGVRVDGASLAPGIYIERRGGRARKVLIK